MIELNLLEKKKPLVLPVVLGIDLNKIDIKMLGIAIVIYYLPSIVISSLYEEKFADAENKLKILTNKNEVSIAAIEKDNNVKFQVDAYKSQVIKLQSRSNQVDEILKNRTNPKKILEKIARSIPEDVWFTRLSINEKHEISIQGGSYTPRAIGEFITNINDSPYLGGSVTPVSQENKREDLDGVLTNYELFELKGRVLNYDMRSK